MADLHDQTDRATSFGSVADVYDRVRPTYPDALVRDLIAADPHDVLDVGCGTGKAARLFAAQGCSVLGVEPDAAMADVARGHGIDVELGTFEQWDDAGRRFDLLISGQAWHWVEPGSGAHKVAAVLRPGGRVGLFWNIDSMAPQHRALLDAGYEQIAPQLMSRNRSYGGKQGPRTPVMDALTAAGLRDVAERKYAWQRRYTADEFVRLTSTFSDHNLLPDEQRARLFDAVHTVVARLGAIDISYESQLITAVTPVVAP